MPAIILPVITAAATSAGISAGTAATLAPILAYGITIAAPIGHTRLLQR